VVVVPQWSADDMESTICRLGAHGMGGIKPDESQLRSLLQADYGRPLQFVNLLAYRETATYPVGHELADAALSGAEAYGRTVQSRSGTSSDAADSSSSTTTCARC
jgi:hypothetical protein